MLIKWINDVSHLLKSMRNALYNNKVLTIHKKYVESLDLPSEFVKWEYIVKLFEFDQKHCLKIAPHLKRQHIEKLGNFGKMKVGWAKAVLNKATGKALRYYNEHYPQEFPDESITTAVFCEKVGHFHDLMGNLHTNMAFYAKNPEKNAESEKFLYHSSKTRVISLQSIYNARNAETSSNSSFFYESMSL